MKQSVQWITAEQTEKMLEKYWVNGLRMDVALYRSLEVKGGRP